jgi:hypothetical protein
VDAKADKATTYTETEVDGLLNTKADQATTYTETEVDELVATRTESPGETTVTGTATFTNSTNNIALTGIGSIGLDVGDVVQVTGTASNNKLFTVEVITNSGNVIVNQAHAGGSTTKSLVDETVSATVTLVAKWFNAPIGLGQGWVDVQSDRTLNTTFTNNTGRSILVAVTGEDNSQGSLDFEIDGMVIATYDYGGSAYSTIPLVSGVLVPNVSTYEVVESYAAIKVWSELR